MQRNECGRNADGRAADGRVRDGRVADERVADGRVGDRRAAKGSVASGSITNASTAKGSAGRINVKGYLDSIKAPWGQLFYKMVWRHLEYRDKKILDFGSGFGITANFLAEWNDVTAIEPNEEMLSYRQKEHGYKQISGSVEQLKLLASESYDLIVCHNVLEYLNLKNREEVFAEFARLLKPDGRLSIVKHNRAGKIMQKAVFEYQVEEALDLLHKATAVSVNFGQIQEYETEELEAYGDRVFGIEDVYGIRMFFGLQRNEWKSEPDWMDNMYRMESAAEMAPEFRAIAFFHHVILRRRL